MWIFFLVILLVCGLGAIGWLFFNKWDQLKLLDTESLPDLQSKKLKYEILRQRIERTGTQYAKKAQQDILKPVGTFAQDFIRRMAGKLTAAERSYQKKKQASGVEGKDPETIKKLMREAEKFIDDELYDRAEKTLIEIVSADPRNVEAYELLGRLYLTKKDFELAKETFVFIKKLSPDDSSVIASIGEVEEKLGNLENAFGYFKKAHELSPNNPKYLDFFIDSAINIGDVHEAMTALDKLSEVNPENKKIEEFEKRIEAIRSKKKN